MPHRSSRSLASSRRLKLLVIAFWANWSAQSSLFFCISCCAFNTVFECAWHSCEDRISGLLSDFSLSLSSHMKTEDSLRGRYCTWVAQRRHASQTTNQGELLDKQATACAHKSNNPDLYSTINQFLNYYL